MDSSLIEFVLQKEKEAMLDIKKVQLLAIANISEISKKNVSQIGDTRDFDWRYLVVDNPLFGEKTIKQTIDNAVSKYKETFKGTQINFAYTYNFSSSTSREGQTINFFSFKVQDPRFTCLLRGLNPDGTERCYYVKKEEEEVLDDIELSLDDLDLDDLDGILDEDDLGDLDRLPSPKKNEKKKEKKSWGQTKTDDQIKEELKASATKVVLPPIFELPRAQLSKEDVDTLHKNKKGHLISEDWTVPFKISRGFVDDNRIRDLHSKLPNVLFVSSRYNVSDAKVRAYFTPLASDTKTKYIMKIGQKETHISFPFIERLGQRNMYYIVFDPQTQDAKFAQMFSRNLTIEGYRVDVSLCDKEKLVRRGRYEETEINIFAGATFVREESHELYKESEKKIPHSRSDNFSTRGRGGSNRGREQVRNTR